MNPPIIVIHGNHLEHMPGGYQRYLENIFREAFNLQGTPLRVEFRAAANPFEGRKAKAPPSKGDIHKALRLRRRRNKAFGS